MVEVESIFLFTHMVPCNFLSFLLVSLMFEVIGILFFIIIVRFFSEHVGNDAIWVLLRIDSTLLCFFIVVEFDLLLKGFLHLVGQIIFLLTFWLHPAILLFCLLHGCFINQPMFQLSFSPHLFHIDVLIVFIDIRVLSITFTTTVSMVVIVLLVFIIDFVELHFTHSIHFVLLCLHLQLLI